MDVDRMTLWQFMACLQGYRAARGGKDEEPEAMTKGELLALGIGGFHGE